MRTRYIQFIIWYNHYHHHLKNKVWMTPLPSFSFYIHPLLAFHPSILGPRSDLIWFQAEIGPRTISDPIQHPDQPVEAHYWVRIYSASVSGLGGYFAVTTQVLLYSPTDHKGLLIRKFSTFLFCVFSFKISLALTNPYF